MSEGGCIGWDIGGAHLKAALATPTGRIVDVVQLPCPLWRNLQRLAEAIDEVLHRWPRAGRHAITMTGELADVFESRVQGVTAITAHMLERVGDSDTWLLAGRAGLLRAQDFRGHELAIASANWLASATLAAARLGHGVLVDVGSTTVDIVPFTDGVVSARGNTDGERLCNDELLYTGVVRTPVHALADRAPFGGEWQTLCAELFATSADVYRLLGLLPDDADLMPSADGRGKSVAKCTARLARMLGRDADEAPAHAWRALAAYLAREQRAHIGRAIARVLSAQPTEAQVTLAGAGAGRFLLPGLADELALAYTDFAHLCDVPAAQAGAVAACAPAAAMAVLGSAASA